MVGSLKGYDAIDKVGNINVPTLLLTGRYDYMTETMMKPWYEAIDAAEWLSYKAPSIMFSVKANDTEHCFAL